MKNVSGNWSVNNKGIITILGITNTLAANMNWLHHN